MATSKRAFFSKSPILKQNDRLAHNGVTDGTMDILLTEPQGCNQQDEENRTKWAVPRSKMCYSPNIRQAKRTLVPNSDNTHVYTLLAKTPTALH